jgi:putative endonuclease
VSFVIPAKAGIQETTVNKQPAVYILAIKRNGTLYVGVTSDLIKRIWEHKNNQVEGFTKRYGVHQLVWYELHESMGAAIEREKGLKEWKRKWKLELVESTNPNWKDLYVTIVRLDSGLRRNDSLPELALRRFGRREDLE